MRSRWAWGGVIGPVAFIGAWVIAAAMTSMPYSSIDDAISRLAAIGSDVRWLMSVGFVVFGLCLLVYSIAIRRGLEGPAWIAALITGVATLAVAALPLDHAETVDRFHGVAAGVGYVSLAAIPLLAARPLLDAGRSALSTAGIAAGFVAAVSLATSLLVDADGLFQRLGLTVVDLWIVASVPVVNAGSGHSAEPATP